jgi:signal transduction histidine kinase/CheY-like chemotaxis protein
MRYGWHAKIKNNRQMNHPAVIVKAITSRLIMGLFFISALAVLLVSIVENRQTSRAGTMLAEAIQNHLISVVKSLAKFTVAEELDQYHTMEDTYKEEYQKLKERLIGFARENNVLYVYYWRYYGNDELQYIIDNDLDPQEQVGPGNIDDIIEEIAFEALAGNTGVTDLRDITPTWDGFITAYAPVYDREGNIYCVAGVDISHEFLFVQRRDSRNIKLLQIITIPLSVFFGILSMLLYRRKAEQAEAATRSKSIFLAAMSHEIRTPMNAIIGIAQIQLQKGDLPDEYTTALEKIYASGSSLLGVINDILDMSKIETGKMELNLAEYDMPSLINDAVQLNIVRIGSKPIDFKLDLNENLPSRLYGDELKLKQILNNLLSNAIKYTEKGIVKLSVDHFMQGQDVMLRFVVEDTGQGMKNEDRERLFSEYSRFNAGANRTTEGTGLGLNITKRLVEMMDGSIMVESEYGRGSAFTVTVKQKAVECPVIDTELAERLRNFTFTGDRQAVRLQIRREPMPYGSVLVVDDVDTNLYVAEGLLSPYKLKIETANSGFAAIEKVQNDKIYDIIFMDHMMPRMDGIETTKKLREIGYSGVIVALTANALAGNDEMFMRQGFNGFISKPIDVRHLNAVLNKFIRDRHLQEAKEYRLQQMAAQTAAMLPDETRVKLLQVFCRDAEKAIVTLRETAPREGTLHRGAGDIKLFTTTAHAMKSALTNIGEIEKSKLAAALEEAGLNGDGDFIAANTEDFVTALEDLIRELSLAQAANAAASATDANLTEDTAYLKEQMRIIKTACEDYDDTAAYAALDHLKKKLWKPQTAAALEKIRDMLFLHSDFDGAGEQAGAIIDALR